MAKGLDEILNGDEPAVEVPQEAPEVVEQEPVAEPQPVRDDQGRFAAKGEEGAPPAPEEKASKGQEAAIVAERRKRQEAEARFAELERKIAEMQAAKAPVEPQAPPPSIWEDDQAALAHHQRQTLEQARVLSRLETSEMLARQAHADFGEVFEPMNRFLAENPALTQQAMQQPHPWEFAYKAYKNNQTMTELGALDLEALKAQLMEQAKAELAATAQAKPQVQIPRSLAGEQSVAGDAHMPPARRSLSDILG